jgi:hypothetical protein
MFLSVEEVIVGTWSWSDGFGFHFGEWFTFALVILLLFASCIALLRLVFRLFKRKGNMDESERDYWRIHGG